MKLPKDINIKKILTLLLTIIAKNKVIVTSIVLLLAGVLVLQRINILTSPKLNQKYLNSQLSELSEVKFDETAINQIKALNSTGVNITSEFTNRDNPFIDSGN